MSAEEDLEAADPNVAELDGVTFVVEDEDEGAADVDPAELEFVDELPEDVALDIAIAAEDIVHGTVVRADRAGVTVSYKLEDGTDVEVRRSMDSAGCVWDATVIAASNHS